MNLIRAPKKRPSSGKVLSPDAASDHIDVVEPPKFVTGRHIAAIFERLGYEPSIGHRIFNTLVEAVARINRTSELTTDARPTSHNPDEQSDSHTPRSSLSGSSSSSNDLLNGKHFKNALSLSPSTSSVEPWTSPPLSPSPLQPPTTGGFDSPTTSLQPNDAVGPSPMTPTSSTINNYRMDVKDFMKACELDDVLVQVLLHRPRIHIAELATKAQSRIQSLASTTSASSSSSSVDASLFRQRSIELTSSLLEEELITALKNSATESKPAFPIANAVGKFSGLF